MAVSTPAEHIPEFLVSCGAWLGGSLLIAHVLLEGAWTPSGYVKEGSCGMFGSLLDLPLAGTVPASQNSKQNFL